MFEDVVAEGLEPTNVRRSGSFGWIVEEVGNDSSSSSLEGT